MGRIDSHGLRTRLFRSEDRCCQIADLKNTGLRTMLFGKREDFAIECYHDPISNETGHVFGRICVWANNIQLGNINEPACILGVLENFFSECLSELSSLSDAAVDSLSDDDAFEFLNQAIYGNDARTLEQIKIDARRYSKFVFLTNWSEAFDGTNAFLLGSPTG